MTFTQEIELRFGTDAALGVSFLTDDNAALTLTEFEAMRTKLGEAMPGCQSLFPDGTSAVCCTDYARQILKGLPGRVGIFGFANENNTTSRVARENIHPCGHDFAVVDDRYVVDPWLRLVAGESSQIVFDMLDASDSVLIADIYGPLKCWEQMETAQAKA